MTKTKHPLASSSWGIEEYNALQRVIDSGMFTMGDNVREFELMFANYFNSKYAVMVNSGSSAILLMIASLFYTSNKDNRLKAGDEIIVPAVSWSTTYTPLYQYGLKIKFVDIDLHTLNYDLNQLELAISSETRAIMIVNLLGNPNNFEQISRIISGRNILIVEDNCESMGAMFNGKYTGTFGLMGAFSTFYSHHISTMEGGLITTSDEELYHILLSLRAHGWTRDLPTDNLVTGSKSDDYFTESFRFVLPGYNLRPLELEGALGIEQLKRLPNLIKIRRENAELLQKKLGNHPLFIIQSEIGTSSWFGFSLIIRDGCKLERTNLVRELDKLGFECRPIVAGNFVKNPIVRFFNYEVSGSLPNAEYIDRYGLFIGNQHYPLTDAIHTLSQFNMDC